MNVRTLCLSILHEREASGYEIRKMCTEGECSYFVEASFGSIYPALARLEEEGLVESRVAHQAGKPSKKIYAITEAGREAFIEALSEPLGEDVFRSPFLLFARFAHLLPSELVRRRVDERRDQLRSEIGELTEMRETVAGDRKNSHANDAWVLGYGLACLTAALEHLEGNMETLIGSARDSDGLAAAAE
ncbi:PadR family transcriptional regulator [Pelagibacterium montanilacus]|uniref:PadR family transcriptional regulator n=1 Tax=Pelagibacterium montanilacus TaxID=2185280 RepID=UPI000F8D49F5|nr:PadR family transcriptional regulator [Pelagibacterium montanilacus]